MRRVQQGFSLLELIGVMAVMAILAGALAPSVFQMLERGYQDAEKKSLAAIADSLSGYIRANKAIPDENINNWSTAVADFAALPPQRVTLNDKNFQRRLYVDPNFFTTANQVFPGYVQDLGLGSPPNSPRLMLISSLEGSVSPVLNTTARFGDVWQQSGSPVIVESDTVLIERINLAGWFNRVVLTNSAGSQAGFLVEAGTEGAVAAASGGVDGVRTVYVLTDSRLGLNVAPYPGGVTQRQLIVSRDVSLRYQTDGSSWFWGD
ncbi:MAG: type II secretion system protein [Pseudomonadota bacterium]